MSLSNTGEEKEKDIRNLLTSIEDQASLYAVSVLSISYGGRVSVSTPVEKAAELDESGRRERTPDSSREKRRDRASVLHLLRRKSGGGGKVVCLGTGAGVT